MTLILFEQFVAARRERIAAKMAAEMLHRYLSRLPPAEARARLAAFERALDEVKARKHRDGKA